MDIILRDIKPSNILFSMDDLGITSIDLITKQVTIQKFYNQFSRQFINNESIDLKQTAQISIPVRVQNDK